MGKGGLRNHDLTRLVETALRYHQAGQLTKAEDCYRQVVQVNPKHSDALHLLGVIAQQRGNYPDSVRLLKTAIRHNPKVSRYHGNLGNTYQLQGSLSEAIESYRRALSLDPGNHTVRHSLACALSQGADAPEAEGLFRQVIEARPDFGEAHYHLGNLEMSLGRLQDAVTSYRNAIALRGDCFEFHFNLSVVLFRLNQFGEAAQSYRRALQCSPDDTGALYSLGVALQHSGDLKAAADAYRRALEQDPDHASALSNLAAILLEIGETDGAQALLARSIAIEGNSPDTLCNFGKLQLMRGESKTAIEYFSKALAIDPFHARSLSNLGFIFEVLGDVRASKQCYEIALLHHPDSSQARFGLGTMQLAEGNFAEGWQNYEARWDTVQFRNERARFAQPQWRGEEIRGARVLVHNEQGLGDTMQFVRYVPMLASLGATVYVLVQPAVRRLLQNIEGAQQVFAPGEQLPEFEMQCSLLSLPLAFRTELAGIPARIPYIKASEQAAQFWSQQLNANRFRVGIVWSGNPKHSRERDRSVPVEQLALLSRIKGTAFYSLQKGPSAAQIDSLGSDLHVINVEEPTNDFADTAAIVSNLDLVITIDTSVAHLAGGMGKRVWILLHSAPDWRWLRGREDSPWYPSARLFRQTVAGNWDDVLKRVEAELRSLVESCNPCAGDELTAS